MAEQTSVNPLNPNDSVLLQLASSKQGQPGKYFKRRPLFLAKSMPMYRMTDRDGFSSFLMSIPAYNRMVDPFMSLNSTRYRELVVKFKDPEDKETVRNFISACKQQMTPTEVNNVGFFDFFYDRETSDKVKLILDVIFMVIIVITMVLCLFSLTSSMTANLFE